LFAPTLADRAILPTAWRGRYFFNRIGHLRTLSHGSRPLRMTGIATSYDPPHEAAHAEQGKRIPSAQRLQ
ncbi:hypothetical protein, partial [Pseudomonas aeruginosa]|uniref:hypothetical protein n=1 Tax=Pseudomonas aeruginosa TaxID=287 RepID=UPI0026EB7B5E